MAVPEVVVVIARPFRLWNPKTGEYYRGRFYKYHRRAVIGALIECKWAAIGTTVEIIDVRTSKMIGQYTRRVNSVTFHSEKSNVKD